MWWDLDNSFIAESADEKNVENPLRIDKVIDGAWRTTLLGHRV